MSYPIITIIIIIGELPVKMDVNWTPQFQQNNLDAKMPPPVLPKVMVQVSGENDTDALEPDGYHHERMYKCDSDTPAPVLPPKPNKLVL